MRVAAEGGSVDSVESSALPELVLWLDVEDEDHDELDALMEVQEVFE